MKTKKNNKNYKDTQNVNGDNIRNTDCKSYRNNIFLFQDSHNHQCDKMLLIVLINNRISGQ